MKQEIPPEVIEAFTSYSPDLPDHSAGDISVEPIGDGLINHSYKVNCELKVDLFLQKINKNVFAHPEDVQNNYITLWEYAEFEFTGLRLPSPQYWGPNSTLYTDMNGGCWRAFEFIDNTVTTPVAKNPQQAKATAKAFAKFTAVYEGMNTDLLKTVIPDFHNLSLRYQQFSTALNTELYERMAIALPLINELKARERYIHFYDLIIESGEFPLRVMHHDAKIANVLFDKKTGKVICPVDYDTVMPGYFFSDLGDMIRSMACGEDENSTNEKGISIRKEYYDAILTGYMDIMGTSFTSSEKKYIHHAGLLIIYMQSLRFITDYLNGDVYYKTTHTEQNFDRAGNQLLLLQSLEVFLQGTYTYKL
jgi:hypothetical protein